MSFPTLSSAALVSLMGDWWVCKDDIRWLVGE